jgi:hypothetical protein
MILRPIVASLVAISIHGAVAEPIASRQDRLSSKIEQENKIAFQGVLNNIGPSGSRAPGASAGIIIASPTTEDPNCMCPGSRAHRHIKQSIRLTVFRLLHMDARCCLNNENDR